MNVFKLGELFCGPGGIACGAMNAKSAMPTKAMSSEPLLRSFCSVAIVEFYF